jgi:hypothetical protein
VAHFVHNGPLFLSGSDSATGEKRFGKTLMAIMGTLHYNYWALEIKRKVFVFAFRETFAFRNKNIVKIIEILLISCGIGKFKTWSHLFLQLADVFAIIFATFRQILMRKTKVFAKIRKRKL